MEPHVTSKLVPLFHPVECSGCLMCQISCAQLHGGTSRPADALVRVLAPLQVANPTILMSARCDCSEGEELCLRVCGPKALRFVPREEVLGALRAGWQACLMVE